MYNIKQNYHKNKYNKEDFLRYFNTITEIYSEKNDNSIEGLDLFNKIIKNIIDNPNEEKYQRLTTNQYVNGKPGRLYQYIYSDETATDMLIMLGFRRKIHEFQEKWILSFKDRIEFFQDAMVVLEKNKQIAIKNKLKPQEEAKQKIKKQKEKVEEIKNKLAGDRAERREIDWVKKAQNNKPLYTNTRSHSRNGNGMGMGGTSINQSSNPNIIHSSGPGRGRTCNQTHRNQQQHRRNQGAYNWNSQGTGQQLIQQNNLLEAPSLEDPIIGLRTHKKKFRNVNGLDISNNPQFESESENESENTNDMNDID